MSSEVLAPFLLAALVLQLVPGPGMLFILSTGIAGGTRAGVAAAWGAAAGMVVHTTTAALGLAALFERLPVAYDVLRIVGGAYLLFLAVSHFRAATAVFPDAPTTGVSSTRRAFVRAWVNNLANPKIILFYLAFLPQFLSPGAGSVPVQLLALGFAFMLIGLLIDLSIGFGAGRIGDFLRRRAALHRALDGLAGTIMGILGLRLLLGGEARS